jgi:carbonic anhydrase
MAILTSEQALERLLAGNRRYATGRARRPNQNAERRAEICGGQLPFAVILGCSDSRVPPEIVLDQGLGDLFVLRVAGNVIDDMIVGTIERETSWQAICLTSPAFSSRRWTPPGRWKGTCWRMP